MFNSIKKAFGFGHKEYTDFEETTLTQSDQSDKSDRSDQSDRSDRSDLSERAERVEVPEVAAGFLDSILAVINANLPPLVSESIDSELQRANLTQLLGPALIDFADKMRDDVLRSLSSDREKMQTELDELRTQKKDFASKREAQKANLLSEQRQRRALIDRNRDLEARIDELQSEVEQHKLTVSSLLNKIRVSEVTDSEIEEVKATYEHQLQLLKAKIEALETENLEQAAKIAELEVPKAVEAALEQRKEIVEAANPPAPKAKKPRTPKKPRRKAESPVKVAVEEQLDELEMVNFLVPGGAPAGHVASEPNPDFGYQPPKPSPEPNPDIQLTLF
ncbi:MAG: hypothetical protein HDR86_04190 [Bacteroides sp.]|nr:hypothetical protein [Bacteroides sp.]